MAHGSCFCLLVCLCASSCGGGVSQTPPRPSSDAEDKYDSQSPPLTAPYDFGAPPEPSLSAASPSEKWWEVEAPCPPGSARVGGVPPAGDSVGCKTENGKNEGRATAFFPSGKKEEEGAYRNHFAEGLWTAWDEEGRKVSEVPYVSGKKHGTETFYYPDGTVKSQRRYEAGERHGMTTLWDEKGRKRTVLTYDSGKQHGREARYNIEGELVRGIDWNHGVQE